MNTIHLPKLILIFWFIACGSPKSQSDNRSQFIQAAASENAMPDKSQIDFLSLGVYTASWWENIPVSVTLDSRSTDSQVQQMKEAVSIWNTQTQTKLLEVVDLEREVQRASLCEQLSDFNNSISFLDDWEKTGKPEYVIGTTVWTIVHGKISEIDIFLNTKTYAFIETKNYISDELPQTDPIKEYVDLRTILIHELGHFLGLAHEAEDTSSIMNASVLVGLDMYQRQLSAGDIYKIEYLYNHGDPNILSKKLSRRLQENQHGSYVPGEFAGESSCQIPTTTASFQFYSHDILPIRR